MRAYLVAFAVFLALDLTACVRLPPATPSPSPPPNLHAPFTGFASGRYRDAAWWLCLPGRADTCARNIDATELLADGTRVQVRDTRAPGADKVDCFYVYPTVDLRLYAANHVDFSNNDDIERVTLAQAARFRSVCRVFVPLYRQIAFGTYLRSEDVKRPYTEVAESDIDDAFLHYMGALGGADPSRKIVLFGHSQGAEMIVHLLQRFFDGDDEGARSMRARLLLAMPIGWPMDVASGKTTGGTFKNIPMCTTTGETGCVVGYRSHAVGTDPAPTHALPPPGHESICVDPAQLAHSGAPRLSRAFFASRSPTLSHMRGVGDVTTPYVMLRSFYAASCVGSRKGYRYLAVSDAPPPGDARVSPVDFGDPFLNGVLGLHLYDVHLGLGDLLDLVRERE